MRIAQFLKNSRLIKRRTVAKEACETGRVLVNGSEAKPGTTVAVGDEIEIRFASRIVRVKVKEISEHVTKKDADELYEIIGEEKVQGDRLFD